MAQTQSGETVVLYLRVPPELHEQVLQLSIADRRKINVTAQILLEEALQARKEKARS
jgi:hypothetical protein